MDSCELNDGRLLAVAWAHHTESEENEPTPFTISTDSGRTFSEPAWTGSSAQTCVPAMLSETLFPS